MGVLYIVAGWVFLQIADVVFDPLGVPDWAFRLVLGLLILGFPFALIFSWVFELTPEGLKRERDIDRSQSVVHQTGQRMNTVVVVLLLIAIGGLIADRLIPEAGAPADAVSVSAEMSSESSPPDNAMDDKTIAVLPFVNMSGDPDNEYFSDGLTEELLNTLVRLGGLKVTGRTSSFAFKGRNEDLREIGQLLNVANVLEGSVRKAGNQVRITAQLIKTSDGYHLWSDTFDRELDDIFSIQAEIAEQVSSALKVTLLGAEQSSDLSKRELIYEAVGTSSSHNAQAYEEYLRGMYIWQRQPDNEAALAKARGHFERALEIDENYIDGYWGMYLYWDRMNRNGHVAFVESLERMGFYAEEIHRLAPDSDRALNSAGSFARVNFEYQQAADLLEEAIRRFPASAISIGAYAGVLQTLGQFDKAMGAVNKALELDPLSLDIMRMKSSIALSFGDCEITKQVMDRALEIDLSVGRFRAYHAFCLYLIESDAHRALPYAQAETLPFLRETASAIFYHALGQADEAQRYLDKLFVNYGDSASYQYGQIYAQWGQKDVALAWLENAVEIRDAGIILAVNDRMLDSLRDEPRFHKILQATGHR
jgi:TolB-like protein